MVTPNGSSRRTNNIFFFNLTETKDLARVGGDGLVLDNVQWGSGECSSHSSCFDSPADHVTCLLVESFALAGIIVWVADGWLFCVDYVVLPCET